MASAATSTTLALPSDRASVFIRKNSHRYSSSASRPEIDRMEWPKRVRRSSNPGGGTPSSRDTPFRPSISQSRVPVVVWVGPSGARATGAGMLFVYASSLAVTSPGSGIGPLTPLDLARKRDASLLAQAIAEVRTWAAARGRSAAPAASDTVLTAQDALLRHVADCARNVTFTGHNPQDCAAIDVPSLPH